MSFQETGRRSRTTRSSPGWGDALVAVLAGVIALFATAALGLWAAGAADLPGNAFGSVAAAVVVMAVGGSVELSGDAGFIADTKADLSVLPLSVTLAGCPRHRRRLSAAAAQPCRRRDP